MEAKFGNVRSLGSCNFCNRGKLTASGYDLIYPYDKVYEIEGNAIKVRICSDCIEQLKNIDDLVDATTIMKELIKNV
ncbi:hypothetical protein D3C87_78470 [compost metagenome]